MLLEHLILKDTEYFQLLHVNQYFDIFAINAENSASHKYFLQNERSMLEPFQKLLRFLS